MPNAPETRFIWVNQSTVPCPDCLRISAFWPREGRTLAECIAHGLPGSGISVCGDACQCALVETAYVQASSDADVRDRFVRFIKAGEIAPVPAQVNEFYDLLAEAYTAGLVSSTVEQALFEATSVEVMLEVLMKLLGKAINKSRP